MFTEVNIYVNYVEFRKAIKGFQLNTDSICKAAVGCIRCKNVVELDTVKPSAKGIGTSAQILDKLAKIETYMLKLCSHGVLHTPKQFNPEIDVECDGIKAKSYAIKANPVRVYGWIYKGTFYASFAIVKKKDKLSKQDAERIRLNFEKFVRSI